MHTYYCWITALLPSYQDRIISGLASKGYMVGPAAKDGKITIFNKNYPSAVIALVVYHESEINVEKIYSDLSSVLEEMKAYFYSVIISASYESTWNGPNFRIPFKPKVTPPSSDDDKKNLN